MGRPSWSLTTTGFWDELHFDGEGLDVLRVGGLIGSDLPGGARVAEAATGMERMVLKDPDVSLRVTSGLHGCLAPAPPQALTRRSQAQSSVHDLFVDESTVELQVSRVLRFSTGNR
jgi:hypothetical protein